MYSFVLSVGIISWGTILWKVWLCRSTP